MPRAYYNEFDKKAAQHLRNAISSGLVLDGDVDDRDVRDVLPRDLAGYDQHHFFAGIGIWSLALRWAGWPDDRPVWTGSCPCQPFSANGRREGFADERHVWPFWHWLITQSGPDTIFGEQVSVADGLAWFDLVSLDLEASGYAVGALDTCSAGVGAPNIRQRLYWVADAESGRRREHRLFGETIGRWQDARQSQFSDALGIWSECGWIEGRSGLRRPIKSGVAPLAPRHPGDVGILRTAGNAINPHVAQAFIRAYLEGAD